MKKMRFVFIEDDAANASAFLEWAEDNGIAGQSVTNILDANKIPADVYVFDLSAIGGTYTVHHCYSPICTIIENHPGADIVIASAHAKATVQEVIDRVELELGRTVYWMDMAGDCFSVLEALIEQWG